MYTLQPGGSMSKEQKESLIEGSHKKRPASKFGFNFFGTKRPRPQGTIQSEAPQGYTPPDSPNQRK